MPKEEQQQPQSMQYLKFESVDQIDGGSVAMAINQALKQAFADCEDRPDLKKARTVDLKISLTPAMKDKDFEYADVKFEIKGTIPVRGIEVRMKPKRDGLVFSADMEDVI